MSAYDNYLAETQSTKPTGSPKVVPPAVASGQPSKPATSAYDRYKQETSAIVTPVSSPTPTPVSPTVEKPSIVRAGLTKVLNWFNENQKKADEANFKMRELMGQGSKGTIEKDPITGKSKLTTPNLKAYETGSPEEKARLIDESNQSIPLVKFLNSPTGKKITSSIAENSSNIPLKLYARVKALGDTTYEEAYKALEEKSKDPNNTTAEKIFYGVQDSGVQSLIGVLVGLSVSAVTRGRVSPQVATAPFFASISADAQQQEKGRVDSVGNIAIDTIGDSVLSGFAESALKGIIKEGGESALKRILKNSVKGFGVEGSTEVTQSFLKYANDYKNAPTEEAKAEVVKEVTEYIRDGGMAQEFLVGGISGGIITGGASALSKTEVDPNIVTKDEEKVDPNSAFAKFQQEKGVDLSKPSIELQKDIEAKTTPKEEETSSAMLEGVDRDNKVKIDYEKATPIADKATEIYWEKKIAPEMAEGKPAVIGADDLKDFFGNDYNDNNHPIYSQGAFKLFELGLQRVKNKKLILTAGGAGSGKTEVVTKQLINRGFDGMIYDSNLANYEGAVKQIEKAKEAGFDVEIYGVLPNLERARSFTIQRQNKVGRGISDATFARGHAGFPAVLQKLLEEGKIKESQVKLLDTRNIDSLDKAIDAVLNKEYVKDVLDTITNLGYNEDNIKQTYAKDNFDQSTGKRTKGGSPSREGSSGVPTQDRGNRENAKRGGDREGVPREAKRKTRSGGKQEEGVEAPKQKEEAPKETKKETKKKTANTLHFVAGEQKLIEKVVSSEGDILGVPVFTYKDDNGKYVVIDKKTGLSLSSNTYPTMRTAIEKEKEHLIKKAGGEDELKAMFKKAHEVALDRYRDVFSLAGSPSGFASIGRYREEGEVRLGHYDQIKPIEFPELLDLAKQLSGNVPFIKKYKMANGMMYAKDNGYIGLNPDLFKEGNIGQLQKTFAHEIGHLIDYLPDQTMTRGNVLGRLAVLKDFNKDFYAGVGATRTNKEMKEELWALSKYWKPIDEELAPKAFLAYRKSAPEVYADFISVMFNDPVLAGDLAPTAYNVFFEQLDKKPEVKKAYFELQDLLRNDMKVMMNRKDKTKNMFVEADQKAKDRQNQIEMEEEMKKKSLWFTFKFQNVSRFEAIRELVAEKQKRGEYINPDDNPVYFLEESNYLGGMIKSIVDEKFNTIYQELQKNDLTWDDLGEITFYERILKGDRGEVANPEGLQIDFVRELYDDIGEVPADAKASKEGSVSMRAQLGEDRFTKLQYLAVQYRKAIKDLYREASKEGMISPEAMKMIEESEYYVPFKPVKYAGVKTNYRIKSKKGTLQPIENPANTGIEKSVSLIRAMERNKVNKRTIDFLLENYPNEVQEAQYAFNGKTRIALEPKDKDMRLVTYMEGGKMKAYYVDQYIGEALRKTPVGHSNMIIEGLRFMNSGLFRPLFITFNVGFQEFNLIRDYWRSIKSYPDTSIIKSMYEVTKNYSKAFRASKIRAFGLSENPSVADQEAYDLVNKLERDRILAITYNDILKGQDAEDRQIDKIMQDVGVRKAEPTRLGKLGEAFGVTRKSPVIKQVLGIMDFIENTGNLIETMPKIAGYYALEGNMNPKEMGSFIRRKVGSPDFLDGGRFKPVVNEIFLFSNAIFQGIRADYELAVNPKTRSGYWWKTAQLNFIPKILMLMATYGLFGDYLKDLFEKISEYDKTNYNVVPLGLDQNGKAVYLRIPQDETGRLLAGLLWKVAGAIEDPDKLSDLETYTNILSYAGGQAPSVTPAITSLSNLAQFISGQNPYDYFRGRPVLTDEQMLAGGMEKVKPFLAYMFDTLGGSVFMKMFTNETVPKDPSFSERSLKFPLIGNLYNRFLRVSNYGETEQIREISNEVRSDNAKENLQNRRVVFEYVDQAQGKPFAEQEALKKQMITEILGDKIITKEDRQKRQSLEKRFDTLRIRGTADPKIDALVTAQTNEEKVALLTAYQETMSKEEFEDLRKFIIKNKVVSSDAYRIFLVNNSKNK